MQKIGNPVALFLDSRGMFVDNGNLYIGVANGDPEVDPLNTFWDEALTVPAAQPIKTLGGRIVNGTNPGSVFIAENDYSMRQTDATGSLVDYSPSVFLSGVSYQPLDSDLTTISGQSNTTYGLNLLTIANQAQLQATVGYTPFTGGTVTTNIVRQGAGVHPYFADAAATGGRIYMAGVVGSADPTSQPGDVAVYW